MSRTDLQESLFVTNEYGITHQNPSAILSKEQVDFAKKEWDINTDLHRTCVNCQVRQMLKYENHLDKNTGEHTKKFVVPCKGIAKNLPAGSQEVVRKMVEEEGMDRARAQLILQSTIDPVAWAELMFGFNDNNPTWYIRNYQKEQLRCSSKRIVIREGRRSGKTFLVALKLLYFVFNRLVQTVIDEKGTIGSTGPTILIVTPYMSQLLTVFDEMERIMKKNKGLCAEVSSASGDSLYVRTPFFHMDFRNGAEIKGFVSGVGIKADGSGGGTMRGVSAQVIYLDEMDMIPEETIDKVIMPILLSALDGDTCFIATSTPIGKRAKFYEYCLSDPTFKEDYLPSTVLPQWQINKALIIGDSTPESIQTEFMAAFIDGNFGVFKPSYVYRARTDYTYGDCNDVRWWKKTWAVTDNSMIIRCIGIDWNKNAGTEFVVITYVPHANKYILSEAVNIPAGEFSALSWREELIRLNYKWKPDYIYADEGYGHTIIEDLKLIAFHLTSKPNKNLQDIETTKLTERLKSFNFSSKVSLRNPLDGTIMEKGGKDFLVETARRIFEDPAAIIRFPEAEEQLKNELLHYTTLRRSPTTNKAVYGTDSERIGDHRLDAMMLGLAGIQIEAGLYSDSAMPVSNPTFLSKERLDKRAEVTPDTPGSAFIKFMEKQSVVTPIGVNVTQIVREGETPEQAASRGNRGARIERRPGHEEPNTVHEHFKKLQSTAGYDTDRESPQSTPKVINARRHNPDRTIRRRG